MHMTNDPHTPKHIVAVSAYVTDADGGVLLVRTHSRSDTWELPGGQVEEGESLAEAVKREFFEETGIEIRPIGITGVYYNTTRHILSVVFYAQKTGGELCIQPEEIIEAKYVKLNESNIDAYITRHNMKSRTLDAMRHHHLVPYETWEVGTHSLLERIEPEDRES
jgi:8-oxo-dGTP diphosphatase